MRSRASSEKTAPCLGQGERGLRSENYINCNRAIKSWQQLLLPTRMGRPLYIDGAGRVCAKLYGSLTVRLRLVLVWADYPAKYSALLAIRVVRKDRS